MNIVQYQILLRVTQCGSFTRAAEELNFTQSGVSHAIHALEQELGVTLLTRGRGGVALTSDGLALMPFIQEICTAQRNMEEKISELTSFSTGLVRISSFASVTIQWLPDILRAFRERYPNVEFEILHGEYRDIEAWLFEGRVDCGFLRMPVKHRLQCVMKYTDELVALMPKGHPLTEKASVSAEDLMKYPFILPDEGTDYEIEAALDNMNIRPDAPYSAKDDHTIMAMVGSELGISILPALVVKNTPYPIEVRPLKRPFLREIGLCVKDARSLSKSAKRFVDFVGEWMQERIS